VTFTTSNGTAIGGASCSTGVDFVNVTQVVTFAPNETSRTVNVSLCGDSLRELTETAALTLSNGPISIPFIAELQINDTANQHVGNGPICTQPGTPASPYPFTITVAGAPAVIGSMRVTLFDLMHEMPDNLDVLLVSPSGQKFILMADAGGTLNLATPVTLTFSDVAGQVLPNSGPLTTGAFEPTSWEPNQSNFAAPAPAGPYNEPGSTVGGTAGHTLNTVFGGFNANGVWSVYVRDDGGLSSQTAINGCIGGIGLEFLSVTASNGNISGRVTTADGSGIRNAEMVLSGNSIIGTRVARTGSFGSFMFDGLATGETYVVTVNSQRFTFSVPSRVVSLVDNVGDANFVADPAE
jgi:hypothetical protein